MFAFIGSHFDILVVAAMGIFAVGLLSASIDDALKGRSAQRNR